MRCYSPKIKLLPWFSMHNDIVKKKKKFPETLTPSLEQFFFFFIIRRIRICILILVSLIRCDILLANAWQIISVRLCLSPCSHKVRIADFCAAIIRSTLLSRLYREPIIFKSLSTKISLSLSLSLLTLSLRSSVLFLFFTSWLYRCCWLLSLWKLNARSV